jgi:hypothetical protein
MILLVINLNVKMWINKKQCKENTIQVKKYLRQVRNFKYLKYILDLVYLPKLFVRNIDCQNKILHN